MREPGARVAVLLALLLPLLALAAARHAAGVVEAWLARPAPARSAAAFPVHFEIAPGQGAAAITRQLQDLGLVTDARALRAWLHLTRQSARLQAGEYDVEAPASPAALVDMLVSGRVFLHAFTVPEGLTLMETAALLASRGWWEQSDLDAAFRNPAPIRALDPDAPDLEGYLFPETYHFAKGTSALQVAAAMAARFQEVWTRVEGPVHVAALGLTLRQVATIASLVEEETPLPQEHRLVASVYHNRLRRGMKMEADPTVIYGMQRDGAWPGGELLLVHLTYPSAYNTYVNVGLPPGPIASFGEAALRASLEPADTELIYFVATGGGGHRFAATHADHLRNVARYRQAQREARRAAAAGGSAAP